MGAVRELLTEGSFHESSVEDVAGRAGVARATLYQHFGSRLGLVDAICETFADNPALAAAKEAVDLPALEAALDEVVASSFAFWASEESVLEQLYGVASVDPAARDFVERQRRDRVRALERLAARLRERGAENPLPALMLATSFETYRELRRHAGLAEPEAIATAQRLARTLLELP
jgi:AcrR family transcriptional regulator